MSGLINPNPVSVKAGDIVFFEEHWSQMIFEAKVTLVETRKDKDGNDVQVAAIKGTGEYIGSCEQYVQNLFADRKSAEEAKKLRNQARIDAYKAEMTDAASIAIFAFQHSVSSCEEYTDYQARAAYKQQVKAILGVDLDALD